MFSQTTFLALVATLPAVNAVGSAIVKNYCSSNVNLWSDGGDPGPRHTIAPGGTYSETYRNGENGGGVSIKMTHKDDLWALDPITHKKPAITQFEYTLTDKIWYDISNIDGNPFWIKGMKIIPGDSSCPVKNCPGGVEQCNDAYNIPTDNQATAACAADSDTTFILCASNAPDKREALPEAAVNVSEIVEREASPEPQPTVAEIHDNMRKRSTHRHHAHRHGAMRK